MDPMRRISAWLLENAPSGPALLFGGPPALLGAYLFLSVAAALRARGTRVGYTRKVFHLLAFATVASLQAIFGTPAVCIFGGAVSLVVLHAVLLASLLGISVAVALTPALRAGAATAPALLAIAAAAAVAEAASPHGFDNLTMQVVPTALAALLLA